MKKAGELGVSHAQVGQLIKNLSVWAKAGVYKKDGDDYEINVRFNKANRYDNNALYQSKYHF